MSADHAVSSHGTGGGPHDPQLAHHFESMDQQSEATTLGMWMFLVTEILFFGGLFMAYVLYRSMYPQAFAAGSHHLDIGLGLFNTIVLIVSSLTMALAVRSSVLADRSKAILWLILTLLLGATFLGVKAIEYAEKFKHHLVPGASFHWDGPLAQNVQMYFTIYFSMTGLHATHMVVGIGLLVVLIMGALKGPVGRRYATRVETVGLYWHFVDIVWIFLFPLLYLLGRH